MSYTVNVFAICVAYHKPPVTVSRSYIADQLWT